MPNYPSSAKEASQSPVAELLKETDYQLSPFIQSNGGLTYFDKFGSPVKDSSPNFRDSPSLKLCPISHSAQFQRQKCMDLKRASANIIKAPVKPFYSSITANLSCSPACKP